MSRQPLKSRPISDNLTLPQGWVWTKLGEVCLDPQYGWTTSAKTKGPLHLLRTTDITSGNINWDLVRFCKEEPPEKEKYLLKDGDIVISRAGSVGFSHLFKNPKKAIFASYLIRFKPLIDGQYLAYFLKSPSYWESISEKSLGIAVPNVNATKLREINIPLPPLPEQQKIVEEIEMRFSVADEVEKVVDKSLKQAERLRQSILKKAFEGKLVPQDPNDEPAEKLLERIKAEKAKQSEKKSRYITELKGSKTTLEVKKYFFKNIKSNRWSIYTLVLNKSRVEPRLQTKIGKKKLYNYLARFLVEKLNLSKVQRNVELVVDRCKNKEEIRDFNQYLINQLEALLPLNTDLNISHLTSQESAGLQAVDLFSWGIFRKYEYNDAQWYPIYRHKIKFETEYLR
jgi:hypothetical protein